MKDTLYKLLLEKGFPEDYCQVMVNKYLTWDLAQMRMIGYLNQYSEPSIEQVTDEMLAILSDRDAHIKKKQSEHAQAVISDIYRNGL